MRSILTRRNTTVAAIALAVGLVIGTAGGGFAGQGGLPADKTSVAASVVQDFEPNTAHPILATRMAVSSPADLILGVTLECTILTRLITNNSNKGTANTSTGSVKIHLTIDGKEVPVTDPAADDGTVTFCNRTYQRKVTDQEDDPTKRIDEQDDYISTKTANAFNWVALNVGTSKYDDPANGNNVLDIKVWAEYEYTGTNVPDNCITATGVTKCSEAYVGKRTLVIEPVHAAVDQTAESGLL